MTCPDTRSDTLSGTPHARRNTRLRVNPDARVRRLPEWGRCLTYAADQPELYDLNATAWLILELCTAMGEGAARATFATMLARRLGADAPRHFDEGLERLLETGLLERAPPGAGIADTIAGDEGRHT